MDDVCPKIFPFRLATWLPALYATYARWLKYLLERLGREGTLAAWQEVHRDDDELLHQILSTGWKDVSPNDVVDVYEAVGEKFVKFFPAPVESVSQAQAWQLVEQMPPIHKIKQTFSNLNVWKEMTAYQALHLRFDAVAMLAEVLIRLYGKQGELIVYDLVREERTQAGGGITGSVAEFMRDFLSEPEEANLFTAGLETEVVQATEQEVVLNVKQCAWATYFREHHPQVGYLMACSTDEVAYRAFNENLRMQRTSTLMEGGKVCDFRIYAAGERGEPR